MDGAHVQHLACKPHVSPFSVSANFNLAHAPGRCHRNCAASTTSPGTHPLGYYTLRHQSWTLGGR
jgi:hypothetical protein